MTAQIYNIALATASTILFNPFVLMLPLAAALTLLTGLAGRVAILLEDLRYSRTQGRNRRLSPMVRVAHPSRTVNHRDGAERITPCA
jgi:hypothetical protein